MTTDFTVTPAPALIAVPRPRTSRWVAPVEGIRMSVPASPLGDYAGVMASCTAAADAAAGANRKDATGGVAFEDPL
jgi:hypothetical protein